MRGYASVPLPFVIGHVAINFVESGSILGPHSGVFLRPRSVLVAGAGLTLSPGRGLLFFFPLSLFAPFGSVRMWRRGLRMPVVWMLALAIIWLAFFAYWPIWTAGMSWGPRFFAPVLPFIVLMALWPSKHDARWCSLESALKLIAIVDCLAMTLTGVLPVPSYGGECGTRVAAACFELPANPLFAKPGSLLPDRYDIALIGCFQAGQLSAAEGIFAGFLLVVLAGSALALCRAERRLEARGEPPVSRGNGYDEATTVMN